MLGELSPARIERLLRREVIGRIGCHADARTYVVPVTYAYEGGAVYGHAAEGLKVRMMRRNSDVCFEVDRIENLANWESVIARGTFEELRGAAALRAMDLLIERLRPLTTSETGPARRDRAPQGAGREKTDGGLITYRIVLTEKSGRFERT